VNRDAVDPVEAEERVDLAKMACKQVYHRGEMRFCLAYVGMFLALVGAAHATSLKVSAEPPLSGERWGDALRSYLDGKEVTVESFPGVMDETDFAPVEPGTVAIILRRSRGPGEDAEVLLVDGEEMIVARLPGAFRKEDLYRAAALKVQALFQRRMAVATPSEPTEGLSQPSLPSQPGRRDNVLLDAGLAFMLPSQGLSREGLRLGTALALGSRLRLGIGMYLEPAQSTTSQAVSVTSWELPLYLSLGLAWRKGSWQGWLDAVGHATVRRISAEAAGIVSNSDTTVSPRAGGAIRLAFTIAPNLRADARVSLLAVLADARYRVDGTVVWPADRALLLLEVGLEYGVR
jgi:hypothetical protein